jgi:hypothetical protein
MSTSGWNETDDRTKMLLRANTWGLNFLVFGLLADILYRSAVQKEAPWDLFALIGATGLISGVYAARHKAVIVNRRFVVFMAIVGVIAALVASVVAFFATT